MKVLEKNTVPNQPASTKVTIRPWTEEDLSLLQSMNTEKMWEYLGGPETEEKVIDRHHRYLKAVPGKTRMFTIMFGAHSAGNVGYWETQWRDQDDYEIGWMVLPGFQGKGIAKRATAKLLSILRTDASHGFVHAFPSVDNLKSNAICEKLGFLFDGETNLEFPPGIWMKCNDWRLKL